MNRILFAVSLSCFVVVSTVRAQQSKHTPTGVIDQFNNDIFLMLTTSPTYSKQLAPQENRPIRVNVSILLFGFGSIDEAKTEFNLHLLLHISWFDERLCPWNATIAKGKDVTTFEGGSWHLDRLWAPSLHVPNSKVPNILQDKTQNSVFTRIQSDGKIVVNKRIILQGVAQMNFRFYPFDVQAIGFEIESNELSYDNLQIFWGDMMPFDMSTNFAWNGFDMANHKLEKLYTNYTHTGTFAKVVATIYLSRAFGQYLLDVYVPMFLFVAISWGSFWIEITAAAARVILSVTVLLTMVTASRTAREKLPPVSYIHALDIWIVVCMLFVFGVIVEYAAVNYIFFKEKRSLLKKNKRMNSILKRQRCAVQTNSNGNLQSVLPDINSNETFSTSSAECIPSNKESGNKTFVRKIGSFAFGPAKTIRMRKEVQKCGRQKRIDGCEEIACEIDRISRIAFPTLFFIFNVVYFIVIAVYSRR